ncbi:helix-turn-helix transcriptional regulator [Streptomyces albiaxialis]|uniref:Helix-turn-helix transcriptional regulator n=1 Tax=Streptomyces albiaxialis TaxID=329523 RepID=A0ABN2W547_9ACTN
MSAADYGRGEPAPVQVSFGAADLVRARGNPDVAGKILGMYLRGLREQRGMQIREVKECIRASVSKISRLERGESPAKEADVFDLLHFYGVRDQQQLAAVQELLRHSRELPWWEQYSDVLPGWLRRLISMEGQADQLRMYETHSVPGLLQTPDYARALVCGGLRGAEGDEVERRVRLRMDRQRLLTGPVAPRVLALLDESVLQRTFGGPAVMRDQMRHLLDLSAQEGINLRVIRFDCGFAAPTSAFTYLTFAPGGLSEMVYLERAGGASYLSKPAEVESFRRTLEQLQEAAERRRPSMEMLREAEERFAALAASWPKPRPQP